MRRRVLLAESTIAAAAVALAGCSKSDTPKSSSEGYGFHKTGLPIVDKTVTLAFSGQKAPLAPAFDTMKLVQEWKKDTNVTVKWNNLPESVYAEKKNLILASGDLPDAFYNTGFTASDIVTYGTNGTLIPLETLIDQHAPNVKALFSKRPEVKASVTSPDGHIYTLPTVSELGIGAVPFFLAINKKWLDQLGLGVPSTIDEFENALQAFKDRDPNRNGKSDEIPFSFISNWWCADVGDVMAALGGMPDNPEHRIVRDGKVIYTAAQEQYKTAVSKLHDWSKRGLIDPEAMTQDDKAYLAKGKTNPETLGAFVWWEIEEVVGADRADDYVLVPALKGVDGKVVGHSNGSEYNAGAFAITRANKFPDVTMRWVDRLYDPVMSAQVQWGPIGDTLRKNKDGVLEQITKKGVSMGEYLQKVAPGGVFAELREDFKNVVLPEPRATERIADAKKLYLSWTAKEWYPNVTFTADEIEGIASIETDLKEYVESNRAKWILNGGIERDWKSYLDHLQSMGLDQMIKFYQDAYDRYNKNS